MCAISRGKMYAIVQNTFSLWQLFQLWKKKQINPNTSLLSDWNISKVSFSVLDSPSVLVWQISSAQSPSDTRLFCTCIKWWLTVFGGKDSVLHVAWLDSAAKIRAEWTAHFLEASASFICKFFQWYQTCGINYHKLLVIKCKVPGGFPIVNPFISGVCEEQIKLKTDT